MNRILPLLLNALILGSVFGADSTDLTYTISNDEVQITDCSEDAAGALVIPATIEGFPVTSIGASAFIDCSDLTSVTIPSGVTSIGDEAFFGCSSLTSVTIPSGVTSIGFAAFSSCSSLTSVTIPSGVTSIDRSAFLGCSSLTGITIPGSVTSLGDNSFGGCRSLTSITIPSGVTSIGDAAFNSCTSLTSITIPSSVTSIGDQAFFGCSSLTSVTIPSGVTSIGDQAFRGCSSLTSIVFEGPVAPTLGVDVFLNVASGATITYPFGATGYSNPFGGLPASELGAPAGLWYDSSIDLGSGWRWFDWFGAFNVSNDPWIYHAEHGWLYPFADDPSDVYFWDGEMGSIVWTSETVYPALYRFSDAQWIFYQKGSSNPRWFVNLLTGQWEQW